MALISRLPSGGTLSINGTRRTAVAKETIKKGDFVGYNFLSTDDIPLPTSVKNASAFDSTNICDFGSCSRPIKCDNDVYMIFNCTSYSTGGLNAITVKFAADGTMTRLNKYTVLSAVGKVSDMFDLGNNYWLLTYQSVPSASNTNSSGCCIVKIDTVNATIESIKSTTICNNSKTLRCVRISENEFVFLWGQGSSAEQFTDAYVYPYARYMKLTDDYSPNLKAAIQTSSKSENNYLWHTEVYAKDRKIFCDVGKSKYGVYEVANDGTIIVLSINEFTNANYPHADVLFYFMTEDLRLSASDTSYVIAGTEYAYLFEYDFENNKRTITSYPISVSSIRSISGSNIALLSNTYKSSEVIKIKEGLYGLFKVGVRHVGGDYGSLPQPYFILLSISQSGVSVLGNGIEIVANTSSSSDTFTNRYPVLINGDKIAIIYQLYGSSNTRYSYYRVIQGILDSIPENNCCKYQSGGNYNFIGVSLKSAIKDEFTTVVTP